MARSLVLTTENVTGLPSITPDPLTAQIDEDGPQTNVIPSSLEGNTFSIVLILNVKYTDDSTGAELGTLPANNFSTSFNFSNIGLTSTKIANNKLQINGTSGNIFLGSYYEFKMPDSTIEVLPPDTNKEYKALTFYNMPSPTSPVVMTYNLNVNSQTDFTIAGVNSDFTSNARQWFSWNFQSAVSSVINLVEGGQV